MSVGKLQLLLLEHGRWLGQDEATDLVRSGLPEERFVEEAMARSRPLTDDERRRLSDAGLLGKGRGA